MNVPKLRFKNENGQDFPEWEDSTIGELINDKSAKFDPAKHGNKFKCIELEHLSQETGILLGCVDAVNQKSIKNMFKKDDVLFGKLRPYLRKFLKAPFDGVCSTEIWVLKGKKISNSFLYQFVQTEYFLMLANISSGSKMPRADWEVIAFAEVKFPSVPEQTKIANFLTAIDEKIEQLIQQVSLLQRYKKGVMQQIFSQQLRFKDEDGNDFPEWEEKTLGKIASFIKDGTHGTHQDTENGKYLLLSAKNIKNGRIYYDDSDRRIDKAEFETIYKNYKLHDGDVLLSVVGTIGRVAIYSSDFEHVAFQRSVAFFRFKNENSQFMAQLFSAEKFQNDLLLNQVVSAQPGIYLGDLAKIYVSVPSLLEQTKIANFLSAIDDKITNAQQQLDATKQYKKSLLQQMFV